MDCLKCGLAYVDNEGKYDLDSFAKVHEREVGLNLGGPKSEIIMYLNHEINEPEPKA